MTNPYPIGVTPKWYADHQRRVELAEAILRYTQANIEAKAVDSLSPNPMGTPIVIQWIEEYTKSLWEERRRIHDAKTKYESS